MKQTIKDEINKLYSLFKTTPKLDVKSVQQHLDTFTHRLLSKEAITPLKRAVNQIKSIGKCAWCGASKDKVQNGFRDELSKKEYQISALCQSCQDEVFLTEEDRQKIDKPEYPDNPNWPEPVKPENELYNSRTFYNFAVFRDFNSKNDPVIAHSQKCQEALGKGPIKASFTIIEGEEEKNV